MLHFIFFYSCPIIKLKSGNFNNTLAFFSLKLIPCFICLNVISPNFSNTLFAYGQNNNPESREAIYLTEKKDRSTHSPSVRSQESNQAIAKFWEIFESGAYDQIDPIIIQLKALYLKDPNDAELALLIAHSHFWKIAERFRLKDAISPNITDDLIIAETYFLEAQKLNPEDSRIDGWLTGVRMSLASIHDNPKEAREAYFYGKKAIQKYPSFNHFSIAYMFSNFDHKHRLYRKAIRSFYRSMDFATHSKVSRKNFDYTQYLRLEAVETDPKLKHAVWNGPKAAHNLEGFFLIMGDFLVKAGKADEALVAYNNVKIIPSYSSWPFKHLLESRIQNIEKNASLFRINSKRRNDDGNKIYAFEFDPSEHMIFNSYNCTICHQK